MTKNTPFFRILHVFAPLKDVRAYIAGSWKTTLFTWIFLRGWYPTSNTSGPQGKNAGSFRPRHVLQLLPWRPQLTSAVRTSPGRLRESNPRFPRFPYRSTYLWLDTDSHLMGVQGGYSTSWQCVGRRIDTAGCVMRWLGIWVDGLLRLSAIGVR